MPNWCANDLYISAMNKHKLDAFAQKVGLKDRGSATFDYGKILPEPDYEKVEVLPTFPTITGHNKPVDSSQAWWDWRVQNWGCKWNINELDIPPIWGKWEQYGDHKDVHYIHIQFESPWSPPEPVIIAAGEQHPELVFALHYFEPGVGFEGELVILNGEIDMQQQRECRPEIEYLAEWKATEIGEGEK